MRTFLCTLTTAIVLASAAAPSNATATPQDHYAGRESWQRVPDIFAAMNIGEGSTVADIGAGGGFFTTRLAAAVGKTGRVLAVDVNPTAVARLQQIASSEGLSNVTVVHSQPDDPKLPETSVDAILIVNAFHEMTEYKTLLPRLRRALRPDGRLVIVDNRPEAGDQSRIQKARHPSLAVAVAAEQLKEAGFDIARIDPEFTRRSDARSGTERVEWLLVARK